MASFISPPPPPLKNNNLFGLPSSSVNANANDGASRTSSPSVSSSSSAAAAAAWFEDDDEALLSQLLLQSDDSDSNDNGNRSDGSNTANATNLNDKLDRMMVRFEQDIISSGSGSDDNNAWWSILMEMATTSGFVCTSSSSSSSPAISRTTSTFSSSSSISLPKAFHTPEGKAHIAALVDLLGVSKERAVRMTLASLRTFAKISTTTTISNDDHDDNHDDDGTTTNNNTGGIHSPTSPSFTPPPTTTTSSSPEQEAARLRSLLGTKELFRQVLHFHRREFLIRLRILTECLRLEQEGKEVAKSNDDEDDDEDGDGLTKGRGKNWGISTSCARLLDQLDARLLIDIRCSGGSSSSGSSTNELLRRGIFHVLLKLATGPALPGLGGRELPYSVGKLRGSSSSTRAIGGAAGEDLEHLLSGSAEILHAIRQESAEALLVLLYDRIHGGVTRLDLFLIMEAASSSSSALLEFGMSGREYAKVVRRRGRGGGGGKKVDATEQQQSKCTLDGLWALICAECIGLWRTTMHNDGDNNWVNSHPLLTGVADANSTDRNRVAAQEELKVLWQKIHSLGEAARDRRGVAYNEYMQGTILADGEIGDDDDALWGVQAPEGVILLAFGLLLRLACLEHPTDEFITEAGGWGQECTQMANDDCAAFSYLLRVLESTVQNPIIGNTVRKRDIGNDALVSSLLKRGAFEMLNYEERELMISDAEGSCENAYDEGPSSQDLVVADAASVICASIGREILTGTIRVFRDSLLSLQLRSSAVENIGMLSDLASVVYRNSSLLCGQFWSSWEIFCQRGGGDMMENFAVDEIKDAEPMCYLLDASHSLAMSTLAESKAGGSPQAPIDYLKPLSSFLHLIASLCANPSMVRSILSSEFLPEGLFSSTMSVITALTPLMSSISESEGRVSADKRRIIRHTTAALESISTLAFLGGEPARAWIRQSLQHSASAAPHIICKIAFEVLSHRKVGLGSECGELLASSALNLLVDLLVGSDIAFQAETYACFAPSSTLALGRGDKMSGFAPLVSNGADSGVTLATMIILNCLSIKLARNVFNQRDISSSAVLGYIETIGCGVMVALDLLSSFVLSSEVSFPTSKLQVATADSILASIVSTLLNLKQLGYLYENDEVRSFALAVRNDILNALSSSTSLGQAVAFIATVTISTTILKKASKSRELSRVMDSAATQQIENEDSKYGAWKMFVTPKRTPASLSNDNIGNDKVDADLDLCNVSAKALSLILVWGEHSDDMKEPLRDQNRFSLCTLLLSKASCSALHDFRSSLNVANLNLISRLASCSYDDVGVMSKLAMLSARIIKMCLRQTAFVDNIGFESNRTSVNLNDFRIALEGGSRVIFEALLVILEKHASDGLSESYSKCMETQALLATVLLETVASSVSSHPDLARDFLLGGGGHDDWRLLDKIASCIASTSNFMNCSREEQVNVHDDRIVNIRYLLTCACLLVISELWRSCRLTSNLTHNSDSVHVCGIITAYLTKLNKTGTTSVVANHVSELIRCSLLAIMAMEDNVTSQDVPIASVNQRCILLDLLSRSLDVITIEIICRVRTKSQGGIKFVEDLFDSFDTGPMECWKELLTSGNADALAAASWLRYTMNVANWNITSFVQANPPEEGMSSSSWCLFGSSVSITKAVKPRGSECVKIVIHSNALHVLCQSVASFSASWATFFEVVAANVIATRSDKEKYQLTTRLVECSMAALESLAESKMVAASQLSGQGLIEIGGTKPFGELCTLLMYSITTRRDLMSSGDVQSPTTHFVQDMLGRLYVASNNIFVMTQLGSVLPSDQEAVCQIRTKLLTMALALFSEFESLSNRQMNRDDMMRYKDIKIGFTDLAVNSLQSLQYVHSETRDIVTTEDTVVPPNYEYDFGAKSGTVASFQLLRVSLSLLSRLAPTPTGSNQDNYSYGIDFAGCLKERSAIDSLLRHLSAASTVASLTYQSVQACSSTQSVAIIHGDASGIVHSIVTIFHALTASGATVVDLLLLLVGNGVFRTLVENPLLRITGKMWALNPSGESVLTVARHRGYYTSMTSSQHDITSSASKVKPMSQNDLVHDIWREVINTFSSLFRSVRCQSNVYEKVDEHIVRKLNSVISVAFDFICTYEDELFSCFSSMLSEARTQSNYFSSKGKTKSLSFSSSIQSSIFAFTPNLMKEAADISYLFAELCKGDTKVSFSRQCSKIYEKVIRTCLDLTKITSSFLGSIANARELFVALSRLSTDMEPTSMFDNPTLADGIPNARHEAICNAHFAYSCCIIATPKDFTNSHIKTTKTAELHARDTSLEQSFQIHVNNLFISEIEQAAGHCLFGSLSVLCDTHPAFDSFTYFSTEEALRFDVAAVITPGTTVAVQSGNQYHQRYLQTCTDNMQYARATSCDRSTRTISVEFLDSGLVDAHVPWTRIAGMEDISKRQCMYAFKPSPKSIGEADVHGPPSIGHLIMALKWCRHFVGSADIDSNACLFLTKCVADRASVLLCTEVLTHDELRDKALRDDATVRQLDMQLLDLFECSDTSDSSRENKSLASLLGEDTMANIRKNLKSQIQEARLEREQEQKLWEQNHVGWGNASLWGSSTKRQGRRSPFRAIRKSSSSGDFA